MAYLGREAAQAPIVTADLPNDGVTLAKMTGGTDGQIITYDASGDPVAVGPGTNGQVLTSTGAGSPPAFEGFPAGHILGVTLIVDVTDGGGGSSNSSCKTLRTLNTVKYEIGMSVTLSSNEWTFDEAGSYLIQAHAPAYNSYRHILELWSNTGNTLEVSGSAEFVEAGSHSSTQSFVYHKVTVSATQITGGDDVTDCKYGLYHTVDNTAATTGLGQYNDDTTSEQHLQVQIFKIQL